MLIVVGYLEDDYRFLVTGKILFMVQDKDEQDDLRETLFQNLIKIEVIVVNTFHEVFSVFFQNWLLGYSV